MNENEARLAMFEWFGGEVSGMLARQERGGWYFWPDPDVEHGLGARSCFVTTGGEVHARSFDERLDEMLDRLGIAR